MADSPAPDPPFHRWLHSYDLLQKSAGVVFGAVLILWLSGRRRSPSLAHMLGLGCWVGLAMLAVAAALWIAGRMVQREYERRRYGLYQGATAAAHPGARQASWIRSWFFR